MRSYEGQRDQLYQQQFNVEQTSFAMASMEDTKLQARPLSAPPVESLRLSHRPQVKAMQVAAKDLKKQFKSKELDINAIDKMTDEMADLMGMSDEIQDALGRNYSVPDGLDEDALMGELDALEFELSAEKETAAPGAVPSYLLDDLPAAPSQSAEVEAAAPAVPAVPAGRM